MPGLSRNSFKTPAKLGPRLQSRGEDRPNAEGVSDFSQPAPSGSPIESISAVIPVHNRADLLARLLRTIASQTQPVAEVIVVDNASSDDAAEVARRAGCRVIPMGSNRGFAHAVNEGWRAATSPWVAILNSDVELEQDWVANLLQNAGHAGFATGTILQASDTTAIDGTYDLLSRGGCAWRAGSGQKIGALPQGVSLIGIAPATACAFRREVLAGLGGFDTSYDSYLEDVDLGLRCIEAGIEGVYSPSAVATHQGSATLGRWNPAVVRLISRNQLLLVAKHYDRSLFLSCLWPIIAGQLLWGLVAARHGAAWSWATGKIEALRGFRLQSQASPRLRQFLQESEREIRSRATDPYWRWYFRLTGAAH